MSPVHLSDEEFEAAVGNALDAIPDDLAAELSMWSRDEKA